MWSLTRFNETQGRFSDSFSELFDDDSSAALHPQLASGMAAVDRNFQQTNAADQSERRTRLDILVRAAKFRKHMVTKTNAQRGTPRRNVGGRNVAYQIAKTVDVDDMADDAVGRFTRCGFSQAHRIGHRRADVSKVQSTTKVSSQRRKEVAAVEGAARIGPTEVGLGDLVYPAIGAIEDEAEEAVVRPHPQVSAAVESEGTSSRTYTGIDDGQMNGAGGKFARGVAQNKSGGEHVLGRNLVGNIHEPGLRCDAQDDPFHRADVVIAPAEIRRQRDDWGWTPHKFILHFARIPPAFQV